MKPEYFPSGWMNRILILLCAFLLQSCYVPVVLEVQTLQPARFAFPDSLRTIGVLNASLTENSIGVDNPDSSSLNENYLRNLASTEFCYAVSENLLASPRFTRANDIAVREIDPLPEMDGIPFPFDPLDVKVLLEDFQTILLVVLEYFDIKASDLETNNQASSADNGNYPVIFSDQSFPANRHNRIVETLVRIYSGPEGELIAENHSTDTIIWYTRGAFSTTKPDITDEEVFLFRNTGMIIGEKIAGIIAPFWKNEERTFYFGTRRSFTNAYLSAIEYNWVEVNKIMDPYTGHRNRKVASIALFNSALSYEMQGMPEKGVQMIEKANGLRPSVQISEYYQILLKRVKAKELLDTQLGN